MQTSKDQFIDQQAKEYNEAMNYFQSLPATRLRRIRQHLLLAQSMGLADKPILDSALEEIDEELK